MKLTKEIRHRLKSMLEHLDKFEQETSRLSKAGHLQALDEDRLFIGFAIVSLERELV